MADLRGKLGAAATRISWSGLRWRRSLATAYALSAPSRMTMLETYTQNSSAIAAPTGPYPLIMFVYCEPYSIGA